MPTMVALGTSPGRQWGLSPNCIGSRRRRTSKGRIGRPFETVHCSVRERKGAGARPTIWVGFSIVLQAVRFSIQISLILCTDLMSANSFIHFVPKLLTYSQYFHEWKMCIFLQNNATRKGQCCLSAILLYRQLSDLSMFDRGPRSITHIAKWGSREKRRTLSFYRKTHARE